VKRAIASALVGLVAAVGLASARTAPAPRCRLRVLNVDRDATQKDVFNDHSNINYDAAGHVKMRCLTQQVFLDADSVSALSGMYVRMYGHVAYRDSVYAFDADTMFYDLRLEKLEARGNVTVLDKVAGSTLAGPWVDYWRAVKGVNDSARVEALKRPTVRYFNLGTMKDTRVRTPYILVGDNLKGFGQSRLSGAGSVTIDRDSVHGDGDSLFLDRGTTSVAQLIGVPAKLRRRGADSFVVFGKEIRIRSENDTIRDLRAFLTARVTRGATDVTGDTIHLSFASQKLSLTLAWNRKSGATLHSAGYDVVGDSLAVDSPGELLQQIRVFKRGMIRSPLDTAPNVAPRVAGDTAAPDSTRNTLWGERIVARFEQVDSSGVLVTRLRGLQAFGKQPTQARSLSSRTEIAKDGKRSPSTNYTRADTIFVVMKSGDSVGVSSVQAFGHVTGMQLETASLIKAKTDTTKAVVPKGGP
jgi:hypothetical protein